MVAFLAVVVEDFEKRRLGAGGALRAAELKVLTDMLNGLEVEEKVLCPLGGALAYRDELGWLEVSVCERGFGLPLQSKVREVGDDFGQLGKQKIHGIAHKNEFSVVCDIAARCLEAFLSAQSEVHRHHALRQIICSGQAHNLPHSE